MLKRSNLSELDGVVAYVAFLVMMCAQKMVAMEYFDGF